MAIDRSSVSGHNHYSKIYKLDGGISAGTTPTVCRRGEATFVTQSEARHAIARELQVVCLEEGHAKQATRRLQWGGCQSNRDF